MTCGIYLLRDPVSGIVRYVGQSKNIELRISQHWSSRAWQSRLSCWIEELGHQGVRPAVEKIQVPVHALDRVEAVYIDRYWAHSFNGKDGGGGFRDDVRLNGCSSEGLFYRYRNYWVDKLKARLEKRGYSRWKLNATLHGGIAWELLYRGCAYALRKVKSHPIRGGEFSGCWLRDKFILEFPK